MLYCVKCGTPLSGGNFCPMCGENVQQTNPYNNYYPNDPNYRVPTNAMAVAGFVVACVSVFFNFWGLAGAVGLILSIVGYSQIQRTHEGGRGLAVAGIVIGAIGVFLGLLSLISLGSWMSLLWW